jgi:hypothetical protein
VIEHRTVLGHNAVKEVGMRTDLEQVVQLPARDEEQLATGVSDMYECSHRLVVDVAIDG